MGNQTEYTLFVFLTLPPHLHCKQIKLFLLKPKNHDILLQLTMIGKRNKPNLSPKSFRKIMFESAMTRKKTHGVNSLDNIFINELKLL